MFKKTKILALSLILVVSLTACSQPKTEEVVVESPNEIAKDYSGTYVGYSWKGESKGTTLEEAKQKIETQLTLNETGEIVEATMLFHKQNADGNWYTRQDTAGEITVDFDVTPTLATPLNDTQEYAKGTSMFTMKTADMMAVYGVAVDQNGVSALMIVDPYTRYQFEFKMDNNFDYSTKMSEMTIGSGKVVPTVRTSGSGSVKPKTWEAYSEYSVLSFYEDPYVFFDNGVFNGLSADSTMQEYLEKVGMTFENNQPQELAVNFGFFGTGGWSGNYKAIETFLVGKDATQITSLIDWKNARYSVGINEENFFGVDTTSGATKTVQNSSDTIAGATVRMSREATSYQRALVEAGILTEEEVIKGRF